MEGVPKIPTPDAENTYEALKVTEELRKKYEAMTREQAKEKIDESIARAKQLQEELQSYNQTDSEGNVIHIHDRAEWIKAKELSREFKNNLMFIPDDLCGEKELPFHPDEKNEKIQYATESLPDSPDDSGYAHKLGYIHKNIPYDERIRVGQQQELSPGQQRAAV